jgi:hypothetical protein
MSTLLKSNCNVFRPVYRNVHNYIVGHRSVQRTLDKLRQQGVRFDGMRALGKQFIEFCPCCQKMSSSLPTVQATPFKMVTFWFGERFDIDNIGPLAKDDYENK